MTRHVHRLAIASGLTVLATVTIVAPVIAADRHVTMSDNTYRPAVVTINAGDTVTWRNDDPVPHDAAGNGWSTSLLDDGASDSVTFRRSGRYAYRCTIHPQMRGTVVVRALSGGATVPPTDVDVTAVRPDPWGSPLILPLLLLTGSAVLLALVWPHRGRPEA
jgi:plastocyanin